MSLARKTDTTQTPIVTALRGVGARVYVVNGAFDLAVWFRGCWYLLDCKSPGGTLTPSQRAMLAEGADLRIVHTVEDALRAIGLEVA